jgi:ribulose-5-phosphate 4-epimerase/fuculose-1-phosphate aldolase
MKEEGVIKFEGALIRSAPLDPHWIEEINKWRNLLFRLGCIGVTEDGVGYGNISVRFDESRFIITGSGTGKFANATAEHYTLVTHYSFNENTVTAKGPLPASSESLTHAMIYECDRGINAVLHVHHAGLWKHLLNAYPSTRAEVAYGTVQMAEEIKRLFEEGGLGHQKIFAMGGHEDGVISFGKNLDEAGQLLLAQLNLATRL